MNDLEEALEIVSETIEDEDFQPCFDSENFMVGPALLGNLSRIHDAIVKAAAKLARLRGIEKGAVYLVMYATQALRCMEHFLPDPSLESINRGEHEAEALSTGQTMALLRDALSALRAELAKGDRDE